MPSEIHDCQHQWTAAELALNETDALDVCINCGQLRYVAQADTD